MVKFNTNISFLKGTEKKLVKQAPFKTVLFFFGFERFFFSVNNSTDGDFLVDDRWKNIKLAKNSKCQLQKFIKVTVPDQLQNLLSEEGVRKSKYSQDLSNPAWKKIVSRDFDNQLNFGSFEPLLDIYRNMFKNPLLFGKVNYRKNRLLPRYQKLESLLNFSFKSKAPWWGNKNIVLKNKVCSHCFKSHHHYSCCPTRLYSWRELSYKGQTPLKAAFKYVTCLQRVSLPEPLVVSDLTVKFLDSEFLRLQSLEKVFWENMLTGFVGPNFSCLLQGLSFSWAIGFEIHLLQKILVGVKLPYLQEPPEVLVAAQLHVRVVQDAKLCKIALVPKNFVLNTSPQFLLKGEDKNRVIFDCRFLNCYVPDLPYRMFKLEEILEDVPDDGILWSMDLPAHTCYSGVFKKTWFSNMG